MGLRSPKKAILPIKVTTFDLWANWLKDWPNRFWHAIAHLKALMVLQMEKFFDFWVSVLVLRKIGRNIYPKWHRPKVTPHPLQPGTKQLYWAKNGPKRLGCWCCCYISRKNRFKINESYGTAVPYIWIDPKTYYRILSCSVSRNWSEDWSIEPPWMAYQNDPNNMLQMKKVSDFRA